MKSMRTDRWRQSTGKLLLWFATGVLAGCTSAPPAWYQPPPRHPKPERARSSYVLLADLRALDQLGDGWYEIENGAWRWMGREATLYLKKPAGENTVFETKLYVPETVIQRVGPPSLRILLNGELLATHKFTQAGSYVVEQIVPPEKLRAEVFRVDLELDRAMPPSSGDQRELGVVVTAVGLREIIER